METDDNLIQDNNFTPENFTDKKEKKQQRPTILTVLCILTFIGSGFSAFSNLIWTFFYDFILNIYSSENNELFVQMYDVVSKMSRMSFFISSILCLASLTGAIFMFNLKKIGFHIYTTANLLLVLVPLFFTAEKQINYINLI